MKDGQSSDGNAEGADDSRPPLRLRVEAARAGSRERAGPDDAGASQQARGLGGAGAGEAERARRSVADTDPGEDSVVRRGAVDDAVDAAGAETHANADADLDASSPGDGRRGSAKQDGGSYEDRVLVWAPTGRDAAVTCDLLANEGFHCVVCPTSVAFCREVAAGAGAAIVADEALTLASVARLAQVLGQQPAWSDVPLIVFTRRDTPIEAVLDRLVPTANVTVLERPARVPTLRSVVRAALRARRRQYEARDLLERLADADRRKDEFLAMLGHELRNPLAAIRNATVLLGQGPGGGDGDARTQRLRGVIERQSHNLTRMVEDLLDVTRVSSGKFVLRREPLDLNSIVSRVAQACEPRARDNMQDLRVGLSPAPALVDGDAVRLEQVVANLVHNAIKYTHDGGRIELTVRADDGQVVLRVSDDGIGIEPAMLPRIFDLFTQVPVSLDRAQGGLGLGLPLVRRIVDLHGGQVRAASGGLDRGSTFEVTLPLLVGSAAAEASGDHGRETSNAEQERRLVVIEDNPDIRECMAELLGAWGYQVAQAADGSEGLELILTDPPRVAIVDVGLPKLDGYDVARRVRARFGPQRVRLIAMTGYGQPQDRERALQAGFDEHLVKPVSPDALARVISAGASEAAAGPIAAAG